MNGKRKKRKNGKRKNGRITLQRAENKRFSSTLLPYCMFQGF
jgi:hypothetical protein